MLFARLNLSIWSRFTIMMLWTRIQRELWSYVNRQNVTKFSCCPEPSISKLSIHSKILFKAYPWRKRAFVFKEFVPKRQFAWKFIHFATYIMWDLSAWPCISSPRNWVENVILSSWIKNPWSVKAQVNLSIYLKLARKGPLQGAICKSPGRCSNLIKSKQKNESLIW